MDSDGSNQLYFASGFAPRWSADKSKIVFTYNELVRIKHHDGPNYVVSGTRGEEPSFSPDGEKIVFIHDCSSALGCLIFTINIDGTGLTQITNGKGPSWSPDGSKIVFYKFGGEFKTTDLWTIKPDGSDEVQLTNSTSCGVSEPVWSPDGSKIAYKMCGGVWVMDANGSNHKRIGDSGCGCVAWSPDGTKILTGNYGQGMDIWILDANVDDCRSEYYQDQGPNGFSPDCGIKGVNITDSPGSDSHPDW